MNSKQPLHEFVKGGREITPLALGVVIYGLAFGLLAAQANMSSLQVGMMGTFVFAGASQILAVERLVAGAGATAALIAAIAINLRLLLVTASIRETYQGRRWWEVVLGAHMTTDENWALMLSARAKGQTVGFWYLVGGGVCLWVAWVASTTLGILFATQIPEPSALGMDFAFTAAFIAIAISLWRGRSDLIPWVASVGVVAFCLLSGVLDASWALILGGCVGALTAGFTHNE